MTTTTAAATDTTRYQSGTGDSAETPRAMQRRMLEYQRGFLIAIAEAMPEGLYRDRATPEQRDFAEQVTHAAGTAAMLAAMGMELPEAELPDPAAAYTRDALVAYVNAAYDYAANALWAQSAASRPESVEVFGVTMTRWAVWDQIHGHTMWTAGQVVANFRKHGMAPPAMLFF